MEMGHWTVAKNQATLVVDYWSTADGLEPAADQGFNPSKADKEDALVLSPVWKHHTKNKGNNEKQLWQHSWIGLLHLQLW